MSLLTAISHSVSGLKAIQSQIQVISSNITNAQREDYTRKNANLTANVITAEGTGGVSVAGYSRATSDSVFNLLRNSLSDDGLRSAQSDYLKRIQTLMGAAQDTPTLTQNMTDFATSWRNLATAPEDTTRKQDVIFKAQNLTREIQRLAEGLDKIQTDISNDVSSAVTTLNTSLSRIAELNTQVAAASSGGQSAVDLMDLRDAEVKKVAALTKINVYQRDTGRIGLYTPGGAALLDVSAAQFSWDGTTITINPGSTSANSIITGGRIEGLLGLLDQGTSSGTINDPGKASVYKVQQQLNKLVDLFTNTGGTFATAYDSATSASGDLASGFFTGSTRYDFALNSALANNTSTIKSAAASGVATDMELANRTITATGINVSNASYASYTDAIIYTHSQNNKQISDQALIYKTQKEDYGKRLQNDVGVNVDAELVQLTQLQNNYSATARVLSTIQQMFETLDKLV